MIPALIERDDDNWLLLGIDTRFADNTQMLLSQSGRIDIHAPRTHDPISTIAQLDVVPDVKLKFPLVLATYQSKNQGRWVCHVTHARRQRFGGQWDVQRFSGYDWAPVSRLTGSGATLAEAVRAYARVLAAYQDVNSLWELVPLIVDADGKRPGPRAMERTLEVFLKLGFLPDLTTRYTSRYAEAP